MASSLKKEKLLKRRYKNHVWDADIEQTNTVVKQIKKYDFFINNKCFEKPKNYKPNMSSILKVYGIKKIDTNNYDFYPEAKSHNVFENFFVNEFFMKLTGWHSMFLDDTIKNPLIYTPIYNNGFKIHCALGHTRLLFKYAVGDIIPFSQSLDYQAYYYDYSCTDLDNLESILGKGNLEEIKNVTPEYSMRRNKGAGLVAPFQNPDWIDTYKVNCKKFWEYIEQNKYELHFYRNGELQFNMNLSKTPLRINIDYEGVLGWIGLCQATLWFFFGQDKWPNDKQYFSIGE